MNAIISLDSEPSSFAVDVSEPRGAWVVYDYDVGPYARAIYGSEVEALRRTNDDGYGRVCFWLFAADLRESIDSQVKP